MCTIGADQVSLARITTVIHILKRMDNSDFLLVLTSRLDNDTLRSLSLNPEIWPIASEVVKDQYFWYLRTQNLVGRELIQRPGRDWKSAYYLLETVLTKENKYSEEVLENLLSVEVLLELGYDPSANRHTIQLASERGLTDTVRLLLQDPRVDPSSSRNYAIQRASMNGHADIVELLLQDKRVDPSAVSNYAIRESSKNGHIDVVKLLLQDKRVDTSDDDNYAIEFASKNRHTDVVELLLQDPRVRLD